MAQAGWHIGCSGFHYKEWKGVFYPEKLPQSKWFDYYSKIFKTLELNVTFYRFPQLKFLQNWYNKAPDDFLFAAKVPRLITHYKHFNDTERMLSDFYGTLREGLGNKSGPVLFQLPAQLEFSTTLLDQLLAVVDRSFLNVIEFRHKSWWRKDVYRTLEKNRIIFCSISHPTLPDKVINSKTGVYYRFHGVPKLYYSAYSKQKLAAIARQVQPVKNVFIYFNNTAAVTAIDNALYLKSYVSRQKSKS